MTFNSFLILMFYKIRLAFFENKLISKFLFLTEIGFSCPVLK